MSREAHVQFWESAEVKSLRATRLWQYGTPGGMAVFDFRMSRKREGPLNFLGNFEVSVRPNAWMRSLRPRWQE